MNNLEFVTELSIAQGKVNNAFLTVDRNGLTIPQLLTLGNIISKSPVKMIDLSTHMQYTGANLTCIADNLEKKGLIRRVRSKEDRRVILLVPTEDGKGLFNMIKERINESLSLNAAIEEVKDLFLKEVQIL